MNGDLLAAYTADVNWLRPELILVAFALLGTGVGVFGGDRGSWVTTLVGVGALVAAAFFAWPHTGGDARLAMNGALSIDPFGGFAKTVIALSAAATLLMGQDYFARAREQRFELPILVVLSTLGMFIMASANDLITLYVGLELQSLAAYVLAAFRRDDARSSEAGLKYFVLGALSSGLLLYGSSLIYGFAGSVRFEDIAAAPSSVGLTFGLVFLLSGLAFKLSAAPFHMWTPDVYEGAPTPVTAFFASAPKLAVVALLARVLYGPFGELDEQWRQVIIALAGITLVVGAFIALVQTNVKRLMAYSSIHNVGFALMALAAGGAAGASAALIYMTIYLPTTIGVFAILMAIRSGDEEAETIDAFSGLAARSPLLASLMTALLFSLAGIPPLAGFFGKYATFQAALAAGLWPLAVVAAVATVVSAAYYLNIVKVMWVGEPAAGSSQRAAGVQGAVAVVATLLAFPVLVVGFGALANAAQAAALFP